MSAVSLNQNALILKRCINIYFKLCKDVSYGFLTVKTRMEKLFPIHR